MAKALARSPKTADDGDLMPRAKQSILSADQSNWQSAPQSRWAFHNIDKVLPSAPIENDPARAVPLAIAPRTKGASILQQVFLKAIVVIVDGQIVYERYANGNDAHAPHILMSASKAVTGLLVGILQSKGCLRVDDPVSLYVPEIGHTAYQGATLRHLLDMRTGVELPGDALAAYEAATNWIPDDPKHPGANFRSFFERLDVPVKPHGGPFRYVSANTDLLGWAIERASGKTVASLLSDHLLKPMGAEDGGLVTLDRQGLARCTGGVCLTARDFARLGQLVVDSGQRGGQEIVPTGWIDDIFDNGDPDAWKTGEWGASFAPISKHMRYRSGWYTIDDAPRLLFAMGIHGQNLFIDKANRIVVAKFSSWSDANDNLAIWMTHQAIRRLQSRLTR